MRDGRDVARSHRDTWGYRSGLKAIEKWPRYIRMAEAFAPKVGPDRYLEGRYENLVGDTNKQMSILEMGWTTDARPTSQYAWFRVDRDQQQLVDHNHFRCDGTRER